MIRNSHLVNVQPMRSNGERVMLAPLKTADEPVGTMVPRDFVKRKRLTKSEPSAEGNQYTGSTDSGLKVKLITIKRVLVTD